jgi:ABC-type uncharacterized transport system fused permease/ATPase subunit
MNRFDRVFWRRLWKLANPYWVSDQKWVALGLLACTLLLSGTVKVAYVVFSYVNRDMMTALASKDAPEFFHAGLLVLIYNIVAAPIIAVDGYVIGKLMIHWRQWLTEEFLARSFHDRAFYRISSDPGVDNPDQRISEDLNEATSALDSANEERLYKSLASARITVVSVGNRAALRHYHHTVLELLGEGAWRLSSSDCSRIGTSRRSD